MMLKQVVPLNLFRLTKLTENENETINFCRSFGLSPSEIRCPNNNGNFHYTHLVLYSRIYLSGCSQFKQVETRLNQLDLVVAHMTKLGIAWLIASLLLWTSTREVVL